MNPIRMKITGILSDPSFSIGIVSAADDVEKRDQSISFVAPKSEIANKKVGDTIIVDITFP